jgi:hypothetical protein
MYKVSDDLLLPQPQIKDDRAIVATKIVKDFSFFIITKSP